MVEDNQANAHREADRDQRLIDFLRNLKVCFKNATIYSMDHPAFIRSVEEVKKSIALIFPFLNPIALSFTPRSLFLDDRFWEEEKIHRELGRLFHFRKIKTLQIRQGVADEELMTFASKITLPLKDFLREGGAQEIIRREKIHHISVEELDYSMLLKGEGEEISDIWTYLMEEGLRERDLQKLTQVTESFEHIIGRFNTEELIANEELHRSFSDYFKYLKETGEENYRKCAAGLVKAIVTNRRITPESKFENLKLLISDLQEKDLADSLWEEIISDQKFDSLSFSIFSQLIEKERHLRISTSLRELFQQDDPQNRRPEVEAKIKALLSGTSSKFISEIYRQTLTSLLKEIDFEQQLSFDHARLERNYRFILLNALEQESLAEQMCFMLDHILKEWPTISSDQDYVYLQSLWNVLNKHEQALSNQGIYNQARSQISETVERAIFEGSSDPNLEYFIDVLDNSAFDVNTYIEQIFTHETITPFLLRAFFKFFTEYLFYLNLNIEKKSDSTAFLGKLVESLQTIDSPMSLVTLKAIYRIGNRAVKLKLLQGMHMMMEFDENFLFQVLKSKDISLKSEALALLMRFEKTGSIALDKVLDVQSPYGIKNKQLIKHIRMLGKKNLTQGRDHLIRLRGRSGFWNKRLRAEVQRVLEEWDAG